MALHDRFSMLTSLGTIFLPIPPLSRFWFFPLYVIHSLSLNILPSSLESGLKILQTESWQHVDKKEEDPDVFRRQSQWFVVDDNVDYFDERCEEHEDGE